MLEVCHASGRSVEPVRWEGGAPARRALWGRLTRSPRLLSAGRAGCRDGIAVTIPVPGAKARHRR
ncbi:hypothetical protein Acsp04_19050 [Actinomadura sp. NBRC 104425]|nr:hypothetical protein Acsp04_19050 [Actinomadura sp. NBRC 104425]